MQQIGEHAPGLADPKAYCAERHHDALGFWPATHKKMTEGSAPVAVVVSAFDESAVTRVPAGGPGGGQFGQGSGGTAPSNAKPVGQGESGQRVKDLQKRLNALGAKPKLVEDGKFGPKTLAAVKAYQTAHGLKADGLVGPLTTAALRAKPGKPTPAKPAAHKPAGHTAKPSPAKPAHKAPAKPPAHKAPAKPTPAKPGGGKLSDKPGSITPGQKNAIRLAVRDHQVPGPDAADATNPKEMKALAESEADALIRHLTSYPRRTKKAAAMGHGGPDACKAVARHITGNPDAKVEHLGGDRYRVGGKTYKVSFLHGGAALSYEEETLEAVGPGGWSHGWKRDTPVPGGGGGDKGRFASEMKSRGFGPVFGLGQDNVESSGIAGAHTGSGGKGPFGATHAVTVAAPHSPGSSGKYDVEITRLNPKHGGESGGQTSVTSHDTLESALAHIDRHLSKAGRHTARPYDATPHAAAEPPAGATVPALATIPGVDILAAGTWQLSTGRQTFTRDDLAHAIDAAKCPAVGPPIIKIGHLDKRFAPKAGQDGEPALGRVTNLRLAGDGHKLLGDLAGMPGWLGVVAASAFPRRSVEGKYRFTCQVGHVHPFVLTALALLGVTPPGVGVLGGLDDVARLYGVTARDGGDPWATAPTSQHSEGGPLVAVTEEDVRRAYYASAGAPPTWWITELQMAPTQLIIADEDTGKTFRVPFTISGSAVQFGPAEELASYEDVAAARGSGTVVAYASAEESRSVSVVAAWDAAAQVANLGDNPSAGAIRALFALPGDSKTDSSLPHHSVSASDHQVGGPDLQGCQAAIAALNGARGGLSGVGADAKKTAYNHLAAHVRDLGGEPAEFKADAGGGLEFDAAGNHGSYSGKHKHPHAAYGTQGGDETHDHPHTHDGDGVHQHAHDPVSAAPPGGGQPTQGGSDMEFTDDQMAAIRAKLGKQDGEEITAGDIAGLVTATPIAASAGDGNGPPEIGDGTYLVDAEILRGYQERAIAGDHAVGQLARNERDQVIAAAVGAGKFSQARAEHYERRWESDPEGTRREIDALAAGLVPVGRGPVGKMGYDADLGGDFEGQQAYRQLYPDDLNGEGAAAAPGVRGGR